MNPEEAKSKFVEENLELLTSDSFTEDLLKHKYRQFFVEKLKKRAGQPSRKELCESLLALLIKRGISVADVEIRVETLPFFSRLDASQRSKLVALIKAKGITSALPDDQLALIRGGKSFEAVEKHLGQKILDEKEHKLAELNRDIEVFCSGRNWKNGHGELV